MKIWKRTGIILLSLLFLAGIYYGSYRLYMYQFGMKDKEEMEHQLSGKSIKTDTQKEQTITQRTKLILQIYDRVEGSMREEDESVMPVEYIGLTRTQLEKSLEDYALKPSLKDVEEGFEKYQIMSFSSSRLVLRKVLAPAATQYKFYLLEENGCITVYYIDKRTVFEYTNILVDTLPSELKEQIKCGKYVRDEDSLYSFLETYTS